MAEAVASGDAVAHTFLEAFAGAFAQRCLVAPSPACADEGEVPEAPAPAAAPAPAPAPAPEAVPEAVPVPAPMPAAVPEPVPVAVDSEPLPGDPVAVPEPTTAASPEALLSDQSPPVDGGSESVTPVTPLYRVAVRRPRVQPREVTSALPLDEFFWALRFVGAKDVLALGAASQACRMRVDYLSARLRAARGAGHSAALDRVAAAKRAAGLVADARHITQLAQRPGAAQSAVLQSLRLLLEPFCGPKADHARQRRAVSRSMATSRGLFDVLLGVGGGIGSVETAGRAAAFAEVARLLAAERSDVHKCYAAERGFSAASIRAWSTAVVRLRAGLGPEAVEALRDIGTYDALAEIQRRRRRPEVAAGAPRLSLSLDAAHAKRLERCLLADGTLTWSGVDFDGTGRDSAVAPGMPRQLPALVCEDAPRSAAWSFDATDGAVDAALPPLVFSRSMTDAGATLLSAKSSTSARTRPQRHSPRTSGTSAGGEFFGAGRGEYVTAPLRSTRGADDAFVACHVGSKSGRRPWVAGAARLCDPGAPETAAALKALHTPAPRCDPFDSVAHFARLLDDAKMDTKAAVRRAANDRLAFVADYGDTARTAFDVGASSRGGKRRPRPPSPSAVYAPPLHDCPLGCGVLLSLRHRDSHVAESCPRRLVLCACNELVVFAQVARHAQGCNGWAARWRKRAELRAFKVQADIINQLRSQVERNQVETKAR
ncbi:hypothetical protein M885DRAFT_505135 [Pelagophyceae sp. CCMP2097]|nr:hypothetical protein M885DRAFT_505135 [Pelagophyceae sp. CCMP2097]